MEINRRLLVAARELVNEYRSHGGPDTHQECPMGARCYVPEAVAALEAAIAEVEAQ